MIITPNTPNLVRQGEDLIPTHCSFCGMQCAMHMRVDKATGQVVGVEPRYDFPVNGGRMCPKGVLAYQQINHHERILHPMIRKNGRLERATWDEALGLVAGKIRDVQAKYGKDAVGLYGGVSMTNEKCYVAGKFARVAVGTKNIDYNGRFCMSAAAGGAMKALGIDRGLFNPWTDVLQAEAIILAGSNTAECHPTAMAYIWEARDRGAKLIVIDPRKTPTARVADVHLQLKPGTDSALINGLLYVLIAEGLVDNEFIAQRTNGFDALRELILRDYAPEKVSEITGVPAALIFRAARMYGKAATGMVMYARGVEQQSKGVENVTDLINLMLATGKIGRPGCGGGTLTGQGNGQGGREHGQKADQLPGYRKIDDPAARAYVASVWGIKSDELPGPGQSAYELLQAMGEERNEVKMLFLYCSNPMVSAPNANEVDRFVANLDFMVVSDFFLSESAEKADVVLPAAVWAEDEGTTTNAEGRVIRINKAQEPLGEAKPDWWIMKELAKRLGRGEFFPYDNPRDIFAELRIASKGGPADYSGITYERIEAENGVFWPCPEGSTGMPRMFEERFGTKDGRANFHAVAYRPAAEVPDQDFPVYLTTGRVVFHYLSGAQTRRIPFLLEQCPEPYVEVHPILAGRLRLENGGKARLTTRRGDMVLTVRIAETIRPDTVFVPYHWGKDLAVNQLTNPALDPVCRMPEFKACAVRVAKEA
ncbi:MAG TPA: molybdopterin oxidoreductase family protein [Symbiobacteriaceae bacterium]|nr:molybdopterin oxidoreductase family protein [Symbiobacteriaceae bacterium]